MEFSLTCLYILGGLTILFSLIPIIRSDYWAFRVFEFPRAQKLVLSLIVLGLFVLMAPFDSFGTILLTGLLVLNSIHLSYLIFPFTPIAPKQMLSSASPMYTPNPDYFLSIMVSNVYQFNRKADKCLRVVKKNEPDVVLLVETDQWWREAVSQLEQHYQYKVLYPLDNTYGMLLYSRLPLEDTEVKFLIKDSIPSIHTKVVLRSGKKVQLYCIHPEPPAPSESIRTTERNAEILKIAKMAKECPLPSVVFGDLNDVAWSYTTKLFLKTSQMLDPRRGRGFYNSFHAKYIFFRWPLDHFFCSKEFRLIKLKRLEPIGSDHFPMLLKVMLEPAKKNEQETMELDRDEKEEVEEKIEDGEEMSKEEK